MLIENLNKSIESQLELTSDHPLAANSKFNNITCAFENIKTYSILLYMIQILLYKRELSYNKGPNENKQETDL